MQEKLDQLTEEKASVLNSLVEAELVCMSAALTVAVLCLPLHSPWALPPAISLLQGQRTQTQLNGTKGSCLPSSGQPLARLVIVGNRAAFFGIDF